jgi:hypothetical protein
MTSLSIARRIAHLIVAASSLLGVACGGDSGQPTYTATDVELNSATAVVVPASEGCSTGETKSCTIFLGRHGDLANCVAGLDVCSGGEWTGCIDEASLAENPELMSQLTAE